MDLGQYEMASAVCGKWMQLQPQSKEAKAAFVQATRFTNQIAWTGTGALNVPADLLLITDKLSMHILARYTDFTPADVNAIVHEDSPAPRNGEIIWLNPGSASIQEAIRNDRGEVLAFNTAAKALLPDSSWSLAGASLDKDAADKPCLKIWFDSRGTKRMAELTQANIGRDLAIVIDGRIVSAPIIASPVSNVATINGNFTVEDVMQMHRAMLPKTPLYIEAEAYEIDSTDSLLDFLGDSLGMDFFRDRRIKDFPPPTEPFAGRANLSEPQMKKLLEWLSSQPSAKKIAASQITVFNGEKAALAIGPESQTEVKLSLLPYIAKRNRIWIAIDYSITKQLHEVADPNKPARNGVAHNDNVVNIGPGDQSLLFNSDNVIILIKASVAKPPAAMPAH